MTELIWDGKYKDGKKTAPVRIALPFQTIETVNESGADRQKNLELFTNNKQTEWRNRLIWGDKKYVLPSLLPEFAGKVNLIYIDPPFNVGSDFSFTATIPDNPETEEDESIEFVKQPSMIEQKAYRDTWGKGLDSYLQWFYETIIVLRELLTDDGVIFVHSDWHINSFIRVVLDELFGYENHLNEIVWCYETAGKSKSTWSRKHDTIYFYKKGDNYLFDPSQSPMPRKRNKHMKIGFDKDGREYEEKTDAGTGKVYRWYFDEGKLPMDFWTDVSFINWEAKERTGYPTQKPESLLERIIKTTTKEQDLVLDCFVGSGTTAAIAENLTRRWIACDLGRFAIHTTRKRLLEIENLKPFVVQNLGKYERQQWISAEFTSAESRMNQELSYRNFILELYHAQPVTGYNWLHGSKSGRMIHVGSVDSPVSIGDVKSIIQEFWKIIGKSKDVQTNGIDVVGWDFAFEINETAKQYAAENKVDLKFKKIPREVLEKRAVEQGDIKFFELASLDIKTEVKGKELAIALNNFIIPPDDIPDEVRHAITHWQQCIDYWAIDWNYRDDTFHNEWQSYRTKKNPNILLQSKHTYDEKGKYIVLVKVIDILGNDTTKALTINIK